MSQAILSRDSESDHTFSPVVERRTPRLNEVENRVREALANSPIQAHRQLRVEQTGETLFLHGRLESFYYKQLAQEIVRSICRNVQVVNEISVD
jgi:hypothetical protein